MNPGCSTVLHEETHWSYNMKSTALIVCISLALSGAALAQQSTGVQGSASGNANASASTDRNGASAQGSAEGAAIATTDDASAGLAQGTELNATLSKPIDARKAKVGDEVTATLNQDITSEGQVAVRKGAKLIGHVATAQPLSRDKGSARADGDSKLGIVFDKAVLSDGREVPLNASVQALAAAQSHASSTMSGAHGGLSAAGGGAGAVRSGGGGLAGGVPGGAAGAVGGMAGGAGSVVHSGVSTSAGALAKSSGAVGGLDASGRLASGSRGVFGLRGVDIARPSGADGSVLTSSTGNVRLDRGTRMLLVNGDASGSAGAVVSKGAPQAAGNATGAAQVTQGAASRSAPEREPVDRR
jgi:hypothetical protein